MLQLLKPQCPKTHALRKEKPPQREAQALQLESSPSLLQLEQSPHSNEDPAQPKCASVKVCYCYNVAQESDTTERQNACMHVINYAPLPLFIITAL